MKRIFTFLICILFSILTANAQTAPPQAFSFKASIISKSGAIVANKTVGLRISIIKNNSTTGIIKYQETFFPKTNEYGQVDIMIGTGNRVPTYGYFTDIEWSDDSYFLKIEVDVKGGTAFVAMSTTQLLSVPYALYADKAGSALSVDYNDLTNKPVGTKVGDMQYWDGDNWVMVPEGSNGQVLTLLGGVPKWGGAGTVPNQSPILYTNSISDPKPNSFVTGGYILSDGGTDIIQRGVCWNTTGTPTISNSKTNEGGGLGGFTSLVTGLTVGTPYYVRAYATNNVGTGYGNEISYTTTQIRVTGITLNSSAITLLPGETSQLTETITPSDAYDKTVTWSSSMTSVATISSSGLVTAVANGITTITARTNDGGLTAVCEVRVAGYNLHGIISSNLDLGSNKIVSVSELVQIAEGVTVTIGPGTVVYGNGKEVQNWGNFIAIGGTSNKITFDNLNLNSKTGGSYDLQYCVFNSGTILANYQGFTGHLNLKYCEINHLTSQIVLYYPNSDCIFEGNIFKNFYGFNIWTQYKFTFKNNRFEQISGYSISLVDISIPTEDIVIMGNSFMDKGQVQIRIYPGGSVPDVDAKNNYWNTTDPNVISSMIYDKNDDLGCPGYVLFTPYLTSPDPLTP
jgi:uncharacterized protein YjdB